jgi:hypothetical protein
MNRPEDKNNLQWVPICNINDQALLPGLDSVNLVAAEGLKITDGEVQVLSPNIGKYYRQRIQRETERLIDAIRLERN